MKNVDWFTKLMLLIIAVSLCLIAVRPLLQPQPAFAQLQATPPKYSHLQVFMPVDTVVDMRNGNLWKYDGSQHLIETGRMTLEDTDKIPTKK